MMRLAKFSRDIVCLARDEFLIIFKGGNILIYTYIFEIVLLVGHRIALHYVFQLLN